MLNAADNEMLIRTGADTPMGAVLRRYWHPALLSQELPEPDCPPVRVRILGQDMVGFRDTNGEVAMIDPRCPHRGASLFFGRNEECGIRCVFHGWKFDVKGDCVDAPTFPQEEPNRSRILAKVKLMVFPSVERGGIIWVYLGPADKIPDFPMFEFTLMSAERRFASKRLQQCNWAQAVEGGVDTAHFSFLHAPVFTSEAKARDTVSELTAGYSASSLNYEKVRWMYKDGRPKFHIFAHDAGLALATSRQTDAEDLYWRVSQFLMPASVFAPSTVPGENYHGMTYVPIDDYSSWVFSYTWNPERDLTGIERASYVGGAALHCEVDEKWVPVRNRDNDYMIDREVQKYQTYTGIKGIAEQDAAIQESIGLIADRTWERLCPTDTGVVTWRRLMLDTAKALKKGVEPVSAQNARSYRVRSGSHVGKPTTPAEQIMQERFGHPTGLVTDGERKRELVPAK